MYKIFVKRFLDIVLSSLSLLLLSPIILVLIFKIKKELGSPVIFSQSRPGLNGRVFKMLKFRTMTNAKDEEGNLLPDSERMTTFGKRLRESSLDELPELWNVLKGDMSLVGPRPLLVEYLPLYSSEQAQRHNVKPGITGYAQVNGRNAITWEEKFKLDVWYTRNMSFFLDMKIILKTIQKVLLRNDINAAGEATMPKFTGSNCVYGIYGASGCGRSLMPVAREYLKKQNINSSLYFIDDFVENIDSINGHQVLNYESFKLLNAKNKFVLIAIANSTIREKLAKKIQSDNITNWSMISTNSIIMDNVNIAEGAAISPFVTIGSNVKIGKFFHANLYSYIEHDCVIGDYVTLAPGVKCNGNVLVGNHAYIGSGAIIKQGTSDIPLKIGKGAIIGMGAVVTKDVLDGEIVVGNPAHPLHKNTPVF